MTPWTRWDGAERLLHHLGGPPAAAPVLGRLGRLLDELAARCPWGDDALMLGACLGLLCGLLTAVGR